MSLIDNTSQELAAMTTGISRAAETAAEADNAALQIAQHARGSGFVGIAQGVARMQNAIKEIRSRLGDVGSSINEARAPVANAPKQMSPEQTIAVLAPAAEKIATIQGGIAATIAKVSEVQRLTATVLQGGQPGPMLSRLGAIKQVLELVAQRGSTAKQHVETALAEARKTGESKN